MIVNKDYVTPEDWVGANRDAGLERYAFSPPASGPWPTLRRMIDCFYDRVETDDALSGFFPGGVSEEHRGHVADWWSEVLGGPGTYTEQHGGYESMLRHHLGLAITPAQRHRFAATSRRT